MIGIERVHRLMEGYKSAAGPAGRYILFLPQGLCACSLPFLSDDSFCFRFRHRLLFSAQDRSYYLHLHDQLSDHDPLTLTSSTRHVQVPAEGR